MKADATALEAPAFWAAFLSSCFGQIGEPFDSELACSAFGVSEDAALAWWRRFTGWYDGILDETDGWLEDPSGVAVALTPGLALEVETHPGETDFFLACSGPSSRHPLGEVGPHWRLPMLRWSEASRLPPQALVLTLPGVWVSAADRSCLKTVERAFGALPLRSRKAASALAEEWLKSVAEGGADYVWSEHRAFGWVSSAHWSRRSIQAAEQGDDVRTLNAALARLERG